MYISGVGISRRQVFYIICDTSSCGCRSRVWRASSSPVVTNVGAVVVAHGISVESKCEGKECGAEGSVREGGIGCEKRVDPVCCDRRACRLHG